MVDLTLSATDVKKSLKVLATFSGSEDIVLPIDNEMGFCVFLDFNEIRSLIPVQIFRILVEY